MKRLSKIKIKPKLIGYIVWRFNGVYKRSYGSIPDVKTQYMYPR